MFSSSMYFNGDMLAAHHMQLHRTYCTAKKKKKKKKKIKKAEGFISQLFHGRQHASETVTLSTTITLICATSNRSLVVQTHRVN